MTSTVVGEASVLIERPVEEVFAFASDPHNEPKWHTDIVNVRNRTPGSSADGNLPNSWGQEKTWITTVQFMGRKEYEVEVTAFELNHRIEFTTRTGPLLPIATCLFKPSNGGTLFTRHTEVPLKGLYRLLQPLMKWDGPRRQERFVQNLKRILEGDGDSIEARLDPRSA
jgi:uncharacterized protein YndB with AHSA1/START domain